VSNSFTALKQFDWNITDWKFEVQGRQSPAQQTRLTWKKKGNVWYVASIEETRGFAPQQARQVLRFDEFEPNVKIPSKLFHLSALELPVGAAICDRREQGHDWRRYRVIPNEDSHQFFDMEAEFESLPP
jgi:hypothetical protein